MRGHALACVSRGNLFPTLEPAFYTFPFVRDANLVIAFAAVFPRTQKKYGPRGYRYILLGLRPTEEGVVYAVASGYSAESNP